MDFEIGYTPNNFKALIKKSGLTSYEIMEALGANESSYYKWQRDPDSKTFQPMSYRTWLVFLNLMKSKGIV